MKNITKSFAWALIVAAPFLPSSGSSLSAQDATPLSLTEEVHTAGQAAYERACASCHLPNFLGSFEAPELAGPNFRAVWAERTVGEFRATLRTMPPTAPNSLRAAEYDAITVYLLAANGLERDGRTVQGDRETTVGSMLTGAVAEVSDASDAGARVAAADGDGSVPSGVTRTFREITDFEPVTEQELVNPDVFACNAGHNRNAELLLQTLRVDGNAVAARLINEIEIDDHTVGDVQDLQDQVEVAL